MTTEIAKRKNQIIDEYLNLYLKKYDYAIIDAIDSYNELPKLLINLIYNKNKPYLSYLNLDGDNPFIQQVQSCVILNDSEKKNSFLF